MDSLRSYPSGHSSDTMMDATFSLILLVNYLNVFKGLKKVIRRWILGIAALLLFLFPLYVGSSRIVAFALFLTSSGTTSIEATT